MKKLVRTPEIAELKAFCIVADLGSFSAAARALSVSQPALSQKMRVLETLTGTSLFNRSTHGVQLTAVGKKLYPEAQKLLKQAGVIEALLVKEDTHEAPVKLAGSP